MRSSFLETPAALTHSPRRPSPSSGSVTVPSGTGHILWNNGSQRGTAFFERACGRRILRKRLSDLGNLTIHRLAPALKQCSRHAPPWSGSGPAWEHNLDLHSENSASS